jgi:glycolate oxidase iron-sulfur subunit
VKLPVAEDDLVSCVSCGLCLPHCPTYRVTGEESASPRGRIAAMRAVDAGAPADRAFTEFMDLCVQCRGCEAACPSSVPFGRLMAGARQALADAGGYQPWWRRVGYGLLGHHRLLVVMSRAAAVAQRLHLVPRRAGLPRLPMRQPGLRLAPRPPGAEADAWLFRGCVMDAWMRPVHQAAVHVMEAAGAAVAVPGPGGACCGALHEHAGLIQSARDLATRVMASMPGDAPIVVDSAGCGAAMKDYGHLLGTSEAAAFAARVQDFSEWLAPRLTALPAPRPAGGRATASTVAVQDPCHLRHVQRAAGAVRTVLEPYYSLVELDDEGLCCGAGGVYATLHPEMARPIRDRKLATIARAGGDVVASANPGCALWLIDAGLSVRHPAELVAEAIRGR